MWIKVSSTSNKSGRKNISLNFRLRKIDELRNYHREYSDEIKQNNLMSKKQNLNYLEHWVILFSSVTGWLSISAFSLPVDVPIYRYCKFCSRIKHFSITEGSKR